MKTCLNNDCPNDNPQPLDSFYKDGSSKDGHDKYCKTCRKAMAKERRQRYRLQVIEMYGGKCECCGEDHPEFLALDHRAGGGNKYRRITNEIKSGRGNTDISMYKWLIDQKKPVAFLRLMCHNCNLSRAFYGYCPHESEKA